jgi:dinuclear metal center YbgI/SA1388 family protein
MLSLKELIQYFQILFPEHIPDASINGLQIEGSPSIKKIGTAVSANKATIEAAIKHQVDALIVHHGLFWNKDCPKICGTKREKIALLLENHISLFAYHLPLDIHPIVGNNWKTAKDLQWGDCEPFGFIDCRAIGVKGKIPPCSPQMFKASLEKYYGHDATCAFGGPNFIQKVALISGGAHKFISEAAKEGVDAFVTGSFDEPTWFQAQEEKIHFFACGHSATERVGPLALVTDLEKNLKIPCVFLDIYNPF